MLVNTSAILIDGEGGAYLKYASYQEEDPADVLILGNSHAADAILPTMMTSSLSGHYGAEIDVFNGAITGMRIEQLYYYCAELLKATKPSLILADSYVLCPLADEHREIVARWTFDDPPH